MLLFNVVNKIQINLWYQKKQFATFPVQLSKGIILNKDIFLEILREHI